MKSLANACDSIIRNHRFMLSGNLPAMMTGNETFQNPRWPPKMLRELAKAVGEIFALEPVILHCDEPLIIVGDIHGHLLDLHRILMNFGYPPTQRYLFLGDFVDRGPFSTECITLIYALKFLYPSHVLIIRGNHEFPSTSSSGGFADEIEQMYPGKRLFKAFCDSFANMPLAAILFKQILCVHGGLCPEFAEVAQLNEIERPMDDAVDPIINGILWSDPSGQTADFEPSRRGTGWKFGSAPVSEFLRINSLDMIVRGHEMVHEGYELMFDGHLLTVFSASNYCGACGNNSAVAVVKSAKEVEPISMAPLAYLKRSASEPSAPVTVTDAMLARLAIPPILKVQSIIVSSLVNPNSETSIRLNISEKLASLTRRRTRGDGEETHEISPVMNT